MGSSPLEVAGFLVGTGAVAYATFVTVSFLEVQKKVEAGLVDPSKYYPKAPPPQKPKPASAPVKKAKDKKSGGKGCVTHCPERSALPFTDTKWLLPFGARRSNKRPAQTTASESAPTEDSQ